jgi:hypothetical protein
MATTLSFYVQYILNLLKPTGYGMHQQVKYFNNCTLCPHCIYVFCICLRTNRSLCHLHKKLIGFYNRDEKCLKRGTDWVFEGSGLRLCHLQHKLVGIYNRREKCSQCGTECVFKWSGLHLCHLQHKLIGFCNRDKKCLQRGTDWVFK